MRDTRREILDAARLLFNQRGYNGVSLQDIAGAVGISKGNLTYHFGQKERIIEALLEGSRDTLPPGIPQTLEELDLVFQDIQEAVGRNQFFFLSHAQLGQISPEIGRRQRARYREIAEKLERAVEALHTAGLVRGEEFPGEYRHTAEQLYFSSAYWAPFSELKRSAGGGETSYRRHAWRTLHPLLTESGRGEMKNLLKQ